MIVSRCLDIIGIANLVAVLLIEIANQQVYLSRGKVIQLDHINEILSQLVDHILSRGGHTQGNPLQVLIHVMLLQVEIIHGTLQQVVHIHGTHLQVHRIHGIHLVIVLSVVTHIQGALLTVETLSQRHHLIKMVSQVQIIETHRLPLGLSEKASLDLRISGTQVWELVHLKLVIVLNHTVQGQRLCSLPLQQVYRHLRYQEVN